MLGQYDLSDGLQQRKQRESANMQGSRLRVTELGVCEWVKLEPVEQSRAAQP